MKVKKCKSCNTELKKDWIALHRKLLDKDAKEFLCISCLADTFGCEVEDLEIKIEEFKKKDASLVVTYETVYYADNAATTKLITKRSKP